MPITNLVSWTAAGSRVVFAGAVGRQTELWAQDFGSSEPRRIASATCAAGDIPNLLAIGPKGVIGCLSTGVSNTSYTFDLGAVLPSGARRRIAAIGVSIDENGALFSRESIPAIFGDGKFLGYLHVTAKAVVQLMRIDSSGRTRHVADLVGLSIAGPIPGPIAALSGGYIVIHQGSSLYVCTTGGKHVATFTTQVWRVSAPTVAVSGSRILVLTRTKRLAIYTPRGRLLRSFRLSAKGRTDNLAAYAGYAIYTGAGKALHAVRLSDGRDRIVAKAGRGSYWNGAALQAPGAIIPLTTKSGEQFPVGFSYVPMAELRAELN
ncbi:MAG: hypothetical protein ABSC51_10260 [Gaiellaceae bacterium]